MPSIDHPSQLSAEQCRRELAGIFAAGILRLRNRRKRVESTPTPKLETGSKSRSPRLEVSGGTVLSVHQG